MSRIGSKPIEIPKGVKVSHKDNSIKVEGPKGKLQINFPPAINIKTTKEQIIITRDNDIKQTKAFHGLIRSLIANMVVGVTSGYQKKLDILGLGYKAEVKGKGLMFSLGYSHPIFFLPPDEVTLEVDIFKKDRAAEFTPGSSYRVIVSGIDKQVVGQVAAKIRSLRKPDSYKGKGIRYFGEKLRLKPGKAGGAAK